MDQTLTNRTSEHICAMLEDQNTSQRAEHSGNNKGDPVQMLFQLEWRASVLLGTWARCRGLMRVLSWSMQSGAKEGWKSLWKRKSRERLGTEPLQVHAFIHAQLPSHVQLL